MWKLPIKLNSLGHERLNREIESRTPAFYAVLYLITAVLYLCYSGVLQAVLPYEHSFGFYYGYLWVETLVAIVTDIIPSFLLMGHDSFKTRSSPLHCHLVARYLKFHVFDNKSVYGVIVHTIISGVWGIVPFSLTSLMYGLDTTTNFYIILVMFVSVVVVNSLYFLQEVIVRLFEGQGSMTMRGELMVEWVTSTPSAAAEKTETPVEV